jgi:hypothetical protein
MKGLPTTKRRVTRREADFLKVPRASTIHAHKTGGTLYITVALPSGLARTYTPENGTDYIAIMRLWMEKRKKADYVTLKIEADDSLQETQEETALAL